MRIRYWALALLTGILLLAATSPVVFAALSIATFSDSGCATPSSTFSLTTTVFSKITGDTHSASRWIDYANPSGTVVKQNAVTTSGSGVVCDATGYALKGTDPTGTWTVYDCSSSTQPCPVANQVTSATFTVNAVPEFPLGILALFVPLLAIYVYLTKGMGKFRRSPPQQVGKVP